MCWCTAPQPVCTHRAADAAGAGCSCQLWLGMVTLLSAADLCMACSLLAGMCGRQGCCWVQLPAAAHCS